MVIGKIKPAATVVAQFAGGVEIDAIQHEGKIYLPVMAMGEFATKEAAPAPAKSAPAPAKEEKEVEEETSDKTYTEEELMEMSTKDLMKICKDEFGIDPDDHDGKNTNKKLRNLILDAQENEGGEDDNDEGDDEDETSKKPAKKGSKKEKEEPEETDDEDGEGDDLTQQVGDILEDFDAGKKNKKKTVAAIVALSDDADEDKVAELVEKFENDEDADIDDLAGEIAEALTAPKKDTKKRGGKKASKKEDLVEPDDLEVGDRVSVWWDDDNQEWYDGEVKSKKKNKIVIAYDDDTEEALDPEVHTKIKRLAK